MSNHIITIGCDPGTTSGIAVWRDDRLLSARNIRNCGADEVHVRSSVMRWIIYLIDESICKWERSDVWWVIEDQWLPKPSKRNMIDPEEVKKSLGMFQSIAKVVEIAGRWCEQAGLCGFNVLPKVAPVTWRSTCGLNARDIKNKKKAAVDLVSTHIMDGIKGDAAEAVLIGLHVHHTRWIKAHGKTMPGYSWAIPKR